MKKSLKSRVVFNRDAGDRIRRGEINKRLNEAAGMEPDAVRSWLFPQGVPGGLSEEQAEIQRVQYGENRITYRREKSFARKIVDAFVNPFTSILLFLASVSIITDIVLPLRQGTYGKADSLGVIIIIAMVLISGILRFVQEARSGNAAEKLLAMITTTATVDRLEKGRCEVPMESLVVGDTVYLSAGDMIPADLRVLEAKDLFISQSSLTGESVPVEKYATARQESGAAVIDFPNLLFSGSNVISGSAVAVVVAVGNDTLLGFVAKSVAKEAPPTSFEKGVNAVSWVLIRYMLIMVPVVFFINGFTKGNWMSAFLFGISIAVGLTPEMLPMIVTTCLSKGAMAMSREKTIIKNLNSIQNLGAIDILCTDKTGTLTQDRVVLEYHLDVHGKEDIRVLKHAFLNSYFQTGLKNLIDVAIIARTHREEAEGCGILNNLQQLYKKVDEVPFDFSRRRMSVVVEDDCGKRQMITKGAVEEMLSVCSDVMYRGEIAPLTPEIRLDILSTVDRLNEAGMRVIAVAQKTSPSPVGAFGVRDEHDMLLIGYLAFLDPPKETAAAAIKALREYGVTTKILTGDNEKVTRCICRQVGLTDSELLLGSDIEAMSDSQLREAAQRVHIFAKLSPNQKVQVIAALRESGHIVGFMGDGINDAAAMKASDVGISVDTAVDIAKESADIVLLEKNLTVLEKGILEGRKTYANMIKYIKLTASSNFGNMFAVLGASALLPFLPMMSIHLLLLNLIYDLSCTAIPWDNVDAEFIKVPRKWDASSVGSFMRWMGPVSSLFDWVTYLILYFIICPMFVSGGAVYSAIADGTLVSGGAWAGMDMKEAYSALFQAGWFVESMWTQTLVIHMIRTPKMPFIQSSASWPLTVLTFTGILVLTVIPFTQLGRALGLLALPPVYFYYLAAIILCYMMLITVLKKKYIQRYGELL